MKELINRLFPDRVKSEDYTHIYTRDDVALACNEAVRIALEEYKLNNDKK